MVTVRGFSQRGFKIVAYWLVICLVVLVDQATKAAISHLLEVGEHGGTLIPGVIELVRVENTGAAFSIGEGAAPLFVVVAIVVLIAAALFIWREDPPIALAVSIGCVAGGGLGNTIDRLASGSVTDFLSTIFIDFPVFNVADMFVTCGVVVSMVLFLRWDSGHA